ncbi:hypothetical protein C8J57DRAFT_1594271 [Mycena rebaudengoi]|nr:hypothetical protein C8J57DRAFT_1594271 [Mycena rebaudengoi]
MCLNYVDVNVSTRATHTGKCISHWLLWFFLIAGGSDLLRKDNDTRELRFEVTSHLLWLLMMGRRIDEWTNEVMSKNEFLDNGSDTVMNGPSLVMCEINLKTQVLRQDDIERSGAPGLGVDLHCFPQRNFKLNHIGISGASQLEMYDGSGRGTKFNTMWYLQRMWRRKSSKAMAAFSIPLLASPDRIRNNSMVGIILCAGVWLRKGGTTSGMMKDLIGNIQQLRSYGGEKGIRLEGADERRKKARASSASMLRSDITSLSSAGSIENAWYRQNEWRGPINCIPVVVVKVNPLQCAFHQRRSESQHLHTCKGALNFVFVVFTTIVLRFIFFFVRALRMTDSEGFEVGEWHLQQPSEITVGWK